jgi:hypothetical protein
MALTPPRAGRAAGSTVKVCAQDETRSGLLPIVRRRIPAWGVQPVITVTHTCENFSLYGAVEPTTGESFFLALPHLHTQMFQIWLDGFAGACAASCNLVGLDNGAFHKAKAVQWPAHVVPVCLPPSRPELNPSERLWRDLKEKLATCMAKTLDE